MEIANAVGTTSAVRPRSNWNGTFSRVMMEGVGARVIRGPDWKWGKQVIKNEIPIINNKNNHEKIFFRTVAKDT